MGKRNILVVTLLLIVGAIGLVFSLVIARTPRQAVTLVPREGTTAATIGFDAWYAQLEQQIQQGKIKQPAGAEEKKKTTASVLFTGDIMLSRTVEKTMLSKNNFDFCFQAMAPTLQKADLAIGNLESPILAGKLVPTGSTTFRANPLSSPAIAKAGFDIMSVANNHFGDQGRPGMTNTLDLLTANKVAFVGGGVDTKHLQNPVIREVNGVSIAFLAYGYGPVSYGTTKNKAGMAIMETAQVIKDVQAAKEQAQVVVVMMHAGIEYTQEPSEHQKSFAHAAIDQGADLVIGHHPHVVQRMEVYNDKYIFYSLGNFVFDQMWSVETQRGLVVGATIDATGVTDVTYYPVVIQNVCQPNLATGKVRDEIMARL